MNQPTDRMYVNFEPKKHDEFTPSQEEKNVNVMIMFSSLNYLSVEERRENRKRIRISFFLYKTKQRKQSQFTSTRDLISYRKV